MIEMRQRYFNELIEVLMVRDIQNLFEQKEDDYKPVRVGSIYSKL